MKLIIIWNGLELIGLFIGLSALLITGAMVLIAKAKDWYDTRNGKYPWKK